MREKEADEQLDAFIEWILEVLKSFGMLALGIILAILLMLITGRLP